MYDVVDGNGAFSCSKGIRLINIDVKLFFQFFLLAHLIEILKFTLMVR